MWSELFCSYFWLIWSSLLLLVLITLLNSCILEIIVLHSPWSDVKWWLLCQHHQWEQTAHALTISHCSRPKAQPTLHRSALQGSDPTWCDAHWKTSLNGKYHSICHRYEKQNMVFYVQLHRKISLKANHREPGPWMGRSLLVPDKWGWHGSGAVLAHNKKGFYKYISIKNTGKNIRPLLKQMGVLVIEDKGKAEWQNAFFASVITDEEDSQKTHTSEAREESWRKEHFPLVVEGWVRRDHTDFLTLINPQALMRCTHRCWRSWQML